MDPRPTRYFGAAVLLGALALVNTVWFRHDAFSTAVAIVLYLLILVVAFSGGRFARRLHRRASWLGALIGALFGIIAGLGSFLMHDTAQDIPAPSKGLARIKLVELANSPTAHIVVILTAMLTFAVLSLIVASLAAITAQDTPEKRTESA